MRPANKYITVVTITALLWCIGITGAHAEQGELSGYVRAFIMNLYSPWSVGTDSSEIETRIRVKYTNQLTGRMRAEMAYEIAHVWREEPSAFASLMPSTSHGAYRTADTKYILSPSDYDPSRDDTYIWQNIDRAFVIYEHPAFDLHVGRQPVAFGSARAVNPTDVLVPYSFDTLAKEERIGVDAIRLKIPIAAMSELDLGVVLGDDARKELSAAFVRTRLGTDGTDLTLTAMQFRENNMLGIDFAGALGGAGAWLEAARIYAHTDGNDYTTLSTGLDYAFSDDLYAFIEYHNNGAGTRDARLYFANTMQEAYTEGNVYLMARDYLMPGLSWQATGLIGISFNGILNLNDGSKRLHLATQYNATENTYLALGGFMGIGSTRTEFARYPDIAYASVSYYF